MAEGFRGYAEYLRDRYGAPAYRVAVDAGFGCPNRGPDRRQPGCLYCDQQGGLAPYQEAAPAGPGSAVPLEHRLASIGRQVERGTAFLRRRYGAEVFLLYLQAFSGTHAPAAELEIIYDFALGCGAFRELIVSTRPDCVDRERAELLSGYRRRGLEVWVELGLQSGCDATLQRIRRGHSVADFTRAFGLLREAGVRLAVHLIFGLPGEGLEQILDTVRLVAGLEPEGLKIHNLHVPSDSPLAEEHLAGELVAPCAARHLEYVIRALELLPPRTLILRLTCDTPVGRLAAPRGFPPKAEFYRELRAALAARGSRQGRLWQAPLSRTACRPPDKW
ncbi:MAG: TIGR01212 family radical SAM protein [Spirochaetes bacterium RBG_16_67_19]|nr:MAG: TIGR01212 family radical SAM protein [Spirochaetes bacterium RBG_16_67_19]